MQNLKIRVNNANESKEIQNILESKWFNKWVGWSELGSIGGFIWTDSDMTYCDNKIEYFDESPRKEITLPELRAMVNPMKEYINKTTGEYRKTSDVVSGEQWVEVPEGENVAYKDPDDGSIYFTRLEMGYRDVDVIWKRTTHPEELPFIDDEPRGLNDQYAEIEQVRQDGLKFDNGKPRHSLLPKGSISSIIAVLEFGAKKYEANNWQKVDNAKERYYDAAMRHIDSWWNGEKFDQETGIHHLAHAATNLFFLKWFDDKENNNG